jgi:hypothetical protein
MVLPLDRVWEKSEAISVRDYGSLGKQNEFSGAIDHAKSTLANSFG